jgi:Tfp pilus assembly protein PilN
MKKHINLYHPSYYPKREKATFSQFLILLFVCILASGVGYFYTIQETGSLNEQLSAQKVSVAEQQVLLSDLVVVLQKSRAPENKLRLHKELQDEIKAKQRLLARLSGIDLEESVSFSELMRGLSYANMPNLSINHFSMLGGTLNITGNAKQSDSVPLWLANIQLTKELSNVAFKAISITENEGVFSFQLSNRDVKGKTNE